MKRWHELQRESLLELKDEVVRGDSIRYLKTKQCIVDFEPVLARLSKYVNAVDLACVSMEDIGMPHKGPTVSKRTCLKWDAFLQKLIVEKSVEVSNEHHDDEDTYQYSREFVVTRDILKDMSERQLHVSDVFPMCEVFIQRVIKAIDSGLELSQKNYPELWV